MGFWQKIFGTKGSQRERGALRRPQTKMTPKHEGREDFGTEEFELKCNKCGSKYIIGKDAAITTTIDVIQASLGFGDTFVMGRVPSAPSSITDPALVSYQANAEAKEKSLQAAKSIQQLIRQGMPQYWWCEKCKNMATPHEFPADWIAVAAPLSFATSNQLTLQITIPDKVGPLVIGKSNYADVIQLLGEPELIENTTSLFLSVPILHLRYPRRGIEFTIDKNKQMCVARIEVFKPFSGSSIEGLRLGIPITDAKKLIASQYGEPKMEHQGYVDWEIPNTFALKYGDGIVVGIKMLG